MYTLASLATPYLYISAMPCKLFRYVDTTKFSVEWVPLIYVASNSIIMVWATILLNNLAHHIIEYRKNRFVTKRIVPPFFYVCLHHGHCVFCLSPSDYGMEVDASGSHTSSCIS